MELNIIWFILLIVLFSGYIILDGFDLGVGMLHFKAKTDTERRIMINSIGPVWDGNEVWLITAGGALFAAFPNVYATVFSGFYTAFILFLLVLILRVASIEFRSKVENTSWRSFWDFIFNLSSYLIALLLGVSLGNIVSGVPITLIDGVKEYGGTFWNLLHPYAIFLGLTAVLALRFHGQLYITMKTENDLRERFTKSFNLIFYLYFAFYVIQAIWAFIAYPYTLDNYLKVPIWFILPAIVLVCFILIPIYFKKNKIGTAFFLSSLILFISVAMVGIGIYPNLVIANNDPNLSLTIFTDSSSQKTLMTMLIIALIFFPIVLIYKIFVYRIFKGKVKLDSTSY